MLQTENKNVKKYILTIIVDFLVGVVEATFLVGVAVAPDEADPDGFLLRLIVVRSSPFAVGDI